MRAYRLVKAQDFLHKLSFANSIPYLSLCKEVIQPQVPLRLPCYDFVPVMNHTVASVPLAVKLLASGTIHFHDVTGGVYKARERIHRDMADSRLLAIPTS